MHHLSWVHAVVLGLLQGVTELFPVSSLGHSVIIPGLFGWTDVVRAQSQSESFFLAFLVGLHVGTAAGLAVHYRRDWARLIAAFVRTLRTRRAIDADERLVWMLVFATIPVGLVGLLAQSRLRVLFAKPQWAAAFLIVNGVLLCGGEVLRRAALERRGHQARSAAVADDEVGGVRQLHSLSYARATLIGASQILALFAGISRSGVTMVAGLAGGLDHEDAARFSFLLATPVILLAGLLDLPHLLGAEGAGVRAQTLVAAGCAGVTAWASVAFLVRWFRTRTLWPFGAYCILAGIACTAYFA